MGLVNGICEYKQNGIKDIELTFDLYPTGVGI